MKWGLVQLSMKFRDIFKNHTFGLNYSDKTLTAQLVLQGKCIKYHYIDAGIIPGASSSASEHLITHSL